MGGKMMKRSVVLFSMTAAIALAAGSLSAQQPAPKKVIALGNFGALSSNQVEQLRASAETELYVPIRTFTAPRLTGTNLYDMGRDLAKVKQPGDVCLIALISPEFVSPMHLVLLTNVQVAVVNVKALQIVDEQKFIKRIHRQIMRGAAFSLGIPPDMDPHSVMLDYTTLDELDQMGLNFSPPWMDKFREAAAKIGMEVRPLWPPSSRAEYKRLMKEKAAAKTPQTPQAQPK
jgi:hypothetical protein